MPTVYAVFSRVAHRGDNLELTCLKCRVTLPMADKDLSVRDLLAVATLLTSLATLSA